MSRIFGKIEGGVSIWSVDFLESRMDTIIKKLKLTEVSRCFHQFEPYGATGVILLAESHFAMHTYPENDLIYFDLFCCNPEFAKRTSDAATLIKETFESKGIEWKADHL
jgi:S-adenosylmethionine decarboxylase